MNTTTRDRYIAFTFKYNVEVSLHKTTTLVKAKDTDVATYQSTKVGVETTNDKNLAHEVRNLVPKRNRKSGVLKGLICNSNRVSTKAKGEYTTDV